MIKFTTTFKTVKKGVEWAHFAQLMDNERYVVGQVSASYNGEDVTLDVYDDGSVILPDGKVMAVDDSVLSALKQEYNKPRDNFAGPFTRETTVTKKQERLLEKQEAVIEKTEKINEQTAETNEQVLKHVKILRKDQHRNTLLTVAIVSVFFVAALLIVVMNWTQIKGQVTGTYNIAVVNTEIKAGDTIEDEELSFVTVSIEEYQSLIGTHIITGDGSMQEDAPIFFVDRHQKIVSKFAIHDMAPGDIVMLSSVSSQRSTEDLYVVETTDKDGNKKTQTIDAAALSGDTSIEYVARVTSADGKTYEFTLSKMLLRDKTIQDILSENGASILNRTESETSD